MRARLTSPRFMRPLGLAAWLFMFALMSTGEFFYFWMAGLIVIIKLMRRVVRETPSGVEQAMMRMIRGVIWLIFVISVIMPLIMTLSGSAADTVLMVWFHVGSALLPFIITLLVLRWASDLADKYAITVRFR